MQDDKKKVAILAGLGLVLVGVGAFTMIPQGASSAEPQPSGWKPVDAAKKEETAAPPRNPAVVAALEKRDPFDEPPEFAEHLAPSSSGGTAASPTPAPDVRMPELPLPRRSDRVRPISGRLNPEPFSNFGPLPGADQGGAADVRPDGNRENGANSAAPTPSPAPKVPEPTFDYTLTGLIVGRRPAAVLRDKQGGQRLVTVGGAIDSKSTLVEVRPGAVIVEFRGKRLRIELKGDTDAN